MKKTIIAGVLLAIATFFVAVGVAEISFPETILTFTDQDWLLNIWPKATDTVEDIFIVTGRRSSPP